MNAYGSRCLLGLLGCLLGCLVAGTPVSAQARLANSPASIRVVTDNNYPPYLFLNADGKPEGYEVDMWRLFEAHTGIKVDLVPMSWAAAQQALLAGQADVIDMIDRTPARESLYDFSAPYASSPVAIYVYRNISGIRDTAALRGFPVGVERGDACVERLRAQGVDDLRPFVSNEAIMQATRQGDLRMFCMDESAANFYLYRDADPLRFYRAFVLHTDQLHRAVRKGNTAMLQTVERGMALVTPAERTALRKRWLDQPIILWPYLRAAGIALAIVLAIVAWLALWVWLLRRTVSKRTQALRHGEAKLRAVFDATPDMMTVKDRDGIFVDCNDGALKHFGTTREQLIGHNIDNLGDAESGERVHAMDSELLRTGQPATVLASCDFFGNRRHHYEIRKVPLRAHDGVPYGILTVARDVTARITAEHELRLAAAAFETQEAMMVTDAHGVIQRVNDAMARLTGYDAEELVGQPLAMLHSPQHDDAFYQQVRAQVQTTGMWQGEQWLQGKRDEPRAIRMLMSRVVDAAGKPSHYICSMVDLTSERVARASIDHLTFFDPVTNLPNRYFLHGRLQHMRDAADSPAGALLMFDIDHFKRVNDLRGHAVGDSLLTMVTKRLRNELGDAAVLCRFGGGTFALLEGYADGDSTAQAWASAKRVREALREPFVVADGAPIAITVGIGWTHLTPGHGTPETAVKEAELAMYGAKANGHGQICRFRPDMQADLQRRETLADELRNAVANDALHIHLQPQVDRAGKIMGAEVLLRWSRQDGEAVSPATFIPIAEESGLILALGDWVMTRSCLQLAAWSAHPQLGRLSLAVNVSARQFAAPGFVDGICQTLATTGAPPARLALEITESVVLGDISQAAAKLARLQALGIRVALDDFGTGYSSLTYLSRLPLDQIKIDQSFVAHLPEDANDAMLARTIIAMGRGLGMEVLAEGVETVAQLDFLKEHGCDSFQGYLIARPMPVAGFETLLANSTAQV